MAHVDPLLIERRLARVAEKLAWLRLLDGTCEASSPSSLATFGASRHRHALSPPIALAELLAFEADIGTTLPDDYRAFLLQLGNGGAGPYYGLAPLARWHTSDEPITDRSLDEVAIQDWYERELPMRAADPRRDFVLEDPFYRLEMTEAGRIHNFPKGGAHPLDGCVFLSEAGCGESCFLVVRGVHAGEVWLDQSQAAWPIRRVAKTFLDWYEHHQDLTLGTALANAIQRGLVAGRLVDSELFANITPIVEAKAEEARLTTPPKHSDVDLEISDALASLAFLRLAQGRVDDVADAVGPLYAALARGGAERGLELIDQTKDPSAELLEARARLLRRLGRDEEALAAWDAAMAKSPFDWDLPRHKAWIQLERGDLAGAEATIMKLVAANQDDREDALASAARVRELAEALDGAPAAHFARLAARLQAEAEA